MSEGQKGGLEWWKRLLGIQPKITSGETTQIATGSNEENYLKSQEKHDAMRLIELGNRTRDAEVKKVGQARLRILEGRPTPEDLDLLERKK